MPLGFRVYGALTGFLIFLNCSAPVITSVVILAMVFVTTGVIIDVAM